MTLQKLAYRPDVDGLRAISILLVLGYHFFPGKLPFGFIGVDIFFAISGYLVTGLICEVSTENFSFIRFYIARFRRIYPALVFLLLISLIVGWTMLLPDEYVFLATSSIYGVLGASNLFEYSNNGYFVNTFGFRPLLHLWSLSVELQFYLVFPILVYLGKRIGMRVLTCLMWIAFISFVCNISLAILNPDADFFSPISRIWEMSIGGAAYVIRGKQQLIHSFMHSTLAFLGLLILCAGSLLISPNKAYPGFWALLPIGAAFILLASSGGKFFSIFLSRYYLPEIGKLSYAIYLWHYPMLEFSKIIFGQVSPFYRICLIGLSFIVALLSNSLIEGKFRNIKKWPYLIIALTVFLVIFSAYILRTDGVPSRRVSEQNAKLQKANSFKNSYKQSCVSLMGVDDIEDRCNFDAHSSSEGSLVVIGDSQANAFTTVLRGLEPEHGVRHFTQFGRGLCPMVIGYGDIKCQKISDAAYHYVKSHPCVHEVLISAQWPLYIGSTVDPIRRELFLAKLIETVKLYRALGKEVILSLTVPLGAQPRRCFNRIPAVYQSNGCSIPISLVLKEEQSYQDYLLTPKLLNNDIKVFDPKKYFCSKSECVVRVGDDILFLDASHLSDSGGRYLAAKGGRDLLSLIEPKIIH